MYAVAADGDKVFFALDSDEGSPVIKQYYHGSITDALKVEPEGADSISVCDMTITGATGWAVGYREYRVTNGYYNTPLLIKYDGRRWRELTVEDSLPRGVFLDVAPVGTNSCWLLYDDGNGPYAEYRILYKFENGTVTKTDGIESAVVTYDPQSGITYAGCVKRGRIQIMVSANGGATWRTETPIIELPDKRFQPDELELTSSSGVLYAVVNNAQGDPDASVVFTRTGPVGNGVYELRAYCPDGPYFHWAGGIAADPSGRVVVVGGETSLYYGGDNWVQESLPDKNEFSAVTAGPIGFYAVAVNGMASPRKTELLYHP